MIQELPVSSKGRKGFEEQFCQVFRSAFFVGLAMASAYSKGFKKCIDFYCTPVYSFVKPTIRHSTVNGNVPVKLYPTFKLFSIFTIRLSMSIKLCTRASVGNNDTIISALGTNQGLGLSNCPMSY